MAQDLGIRLFAFGGAYWPLATAHSDPLWVRTCFGCRKGGSRVWKPNPRARGVPAKVTAGGGPKAALAGPQEARPGLAEAAIAELLGTVAEP